jgi:hypothetical protein
MSSNINSNQTIVIESDDEPDQQQTVPEPQLSLLRDAINNASQTVLAKTLLEICEHNEAGRELAKGLLLPQLTPPARRQGTKRSASPTEVIDRRCERCGRQFSNTTQVLKDCMYHPGEYFRGRLLTIS